MSYDDRPITGERVSIMVSLESHFSLHRLFGLARAAARVRTQQKRKRIELATHSSVSIASEVAIAEAKTVLKYTSSPPPQHPWLPTH